MSDFLNRKDLTYKPDKIYNINVSDGTTNTTSSSDMLQSESEKVITRLLDHLSLIDEYNKRLDSIDYLINNADKLVTNLEYKTEQQDILDAIKSLGGSGSYVTFDLFKKSVDMIVDNYKNMSAIALSGVKP